MLHLYEVASTTLVIYLMLREAPLGAPCGVNLLQSTSSQPPITIPFAAVATITRVSGGTPNCVQLDTDLTGVIFSG